METNFAEPQNTRLITPIGTAALPPSAVPDAATPPSPFGRLAAISAALLSTVMAVPGIGGLLLIAFLVVVISDDLRKRDFRDAELFLWIGLVLIIALGGFILNFFYWRMAFSRKMKTVTRKVVWGISIFCNLTLIILLTLGLLLTDTVHGNGWLVLWISSIFLMCVISTGGFVEEFRAY